MDGQRRHGSSSGWSLVELLIVLGASLVVAAWALAGLGAMAADARATGAARHLVARLRQERLEAVRTGRTCGLRFRDGGGGVIFEAVADGNGNGLRAAEIDTGVDVTRGAPVRLADAFAGTRFAIVDAVPSIDGGPGLPAGGDPIRLGSTILAFSPSGGSTSGTIYVASADSRQFAIRILGATGRIRLYELDRPRGRWLPR
jgi:type II secretory pathway pseudopilin PulG